MEVSCQRLPPGSLINALSSFAHLLSKPALISLALAALIELGKERKTEEIRVKTRSFFMGKRMTQDYHKRVVSF